MERTSWVPTAETTFGIATALTGLGILTMVLAPLALPILILTIASLLPLLAIGLAAVLPIALIAAVVLAVGALRRRVSRASTARTTTIRGPLASAPRSPRRA